MISSVQKLSSKSQKYVLFFHRSSLIKTFCFQGLIVPVLPLWVFVKVIYLIQGFRAIKAKLYIMFLNNNLLIFLLADVTPFKFPILSFKEKSCTVVPLSLLFILFEESTTVSISLNYSKFSLFITLFSLVFLFPPAPFYIF